MKIPKNHPRKKSLQQRALLEKGLKQGIVTPAGLVAFGRGEALDYLLGEKTTAHAKKAIRAAAARIILSKTPVISVNGNTACLVPKEIRELAKLTGAKVEVNTFYPPKKRRKLIAKKLEKFGIKALGANPTKKLAGINSNRTLVDKNGIWTADTALVAIEDGDRTLALKKNGKKTIAIDLNPKSRTAIAADITIVDNVARAIPLIAMKVKKLKNTPTTKLERMVKEFDNKKNLKASLKTIRQNY